MKALKIALLGILVSTATAVMATSVNTIDSVKLSTELTTKGTDEQASLNRAKIVNMIVELELPDGSTELVDNIDFCTPGGFYNGVEAVVFGDEAIKIMQAGMAALYPETGDTVNQMWTNKSNPGDLRLPTFMMIKSPESTLAKSAQGVAISDKTFGSSAKVYKLDDKTPMLVSTCGGYRHVKTIETS